MRTFSLQAYLCGVVGVVGLCAGCSVDLGREHLGNQRSALRHAAPQLVELPAASGLLAHADVFLRAGWGSALTQLGKQDEASRPGPMSLTVGADGSLYVLDQVNRRVLRFAKDGHALGKVATVPATTEDIVVSGDALYALVYERMPTPGLRLERHIVADSDAPARLSLSRSIQLATGLFVSGSAASPNVWVETRHDRLIRVATAGRLLAAGEQRQQVLGRPTRDQTGTRLTALRSGARSARVLRIGVGGAELAVEVRTRRALLGLHALASDAAGRIYLGLLLAATAARPARKVLVVAETGGFRVLELSNERITDAFRPLAVGADGTVYQLSASERGVVIYRWPSPVVAARTGGAS